MCIRTASLIGNKVSSMKHFVMWKVISRVETGSVMETILFCTLDSSRDSFSSTCDLLLTHVILASVMVAVLGPWQTLGNSPLTKQYTAHCFIILIFVNVFSSFSSFEVCNATDLYCVSSSRICQQLPLYHLLFSLIFKNILQRLFSVTCITL